MRLPLDQAVKTGSQSGGLRCLALLGNWKKHFCCVDLVGREVLSEYFASPTGLNVDYFLSNIYRLISMTRVLAQMLAIRG